VNHRCGLHVPLQESTPGGGLEGHVRRVHAVGGTVVDHHLDTGNGKLHFGAFGQAVSETLLTGRDKGCGDGAAGHFVDKNKLFPFHRLHVTGHPAELARTAGLLLVGVVELGPAGDGFPVGHPGRAGGHFGLVLPAHAFDIDFQMEFAHTGDDRIAGFFAHIGAKGRVFLGKAVQGLGHVDFRLVVLGDNGQRDHRFRHIHGVMVRLTPGR
jgi:hypothetical protein